MKEKKEMKENDKRQVEEYKKKENRKEKEVDENYKEHIRT